MLNVECKALHIKGCVCVGGGGSGTQPPKPTTVLLMTRHLEI